MNGKIRPLTRMDWGPENQRMRADAIKELMSQGMTWARAEDYCDQHMFPADVRENDEYQVIVKPIKQGQGFFSGCYFQCISIMRRDRKAVQDWRDLQAIKNQLFSPEHEAIELYPAESRVWDTQNQIHLYVLLDHEGKSCPRFPLGGSFRNCIAEDRWQRPRPEAAATDDIALKG